jgi:tryptophanyl-tRNA synthetase
MRAVTDGGPTEPNQEKPEAIRNLFQLMSLVSSKDTIEHFENTWNNCTIRYGDMKKQLAEDMIIFTDPIRERIKDIASNEDYLKKVIREGGEKARESAQKTLTEVRSIIGFTN